MARHKGNLEQAVLGVAALKQLQDGDRILISEGCTHHRQCGDIGTEKLPKWIQDFTGKHFNFSWTSGTEFPDYPLRRLHAERAGNAVPVPLRCRPERTYD